MPEIIDRVFAKTSQNARFLLSENERFELVFVKTGSINSGTEVLRLLHGCWAYCQFFHAEFGHQSSDRINTSTNRYPMKLVIFTFFRIK